jgi:hypothetical protein
LNNVFVKVTLDGIVAFGVIISHIILFVADVICRDVACRILLQFKFTPEITPSCLCFISFVSFEPLSPFFLLLRVTYWQQHFKM